MHLTPTDDIVEGKHAKIQIIYKQRKMHLTPTDDIVALNECKLAAKWKWVSEKVLNTAGVYT
jgi:hypothetical protein